MESIAATSLRFTSVSLIVCFGAEPNFDVIHENICRHFYNPHFSICLFLFSTHVDATPLPVFWGHGLTNIFPATKVSSAIIENIKKENFGSCFEKSHQKSSKITRAPLKMELCNVFLGPQGISIKRLITQLRQMRRAH